MAAKKQTTKNIDQMARVDPIALAAYAKQIGAQLDNPPVALDRASFVTGTVSTGSLALDLITGGGTPPGKIVDIFGPEGSGKSTLIYHTLGNCMRESCKGANDAIPTFLFDHEAGADGKYLQSVGIRIRLENGEANPLFQYFQPTTGESTYRFINRILDVLPDYTGDNGGRPRPSVMFVIDSLAAMLPEDVDTNDDKNPVGGGARVHSEGMKMIKSKLGRKNATLLCTNQVREKPMAMGNPEYEPGGQAVKFYPDLKFRISAVGKPWEERGRILRFVNIVTKKNKQFVPFIEMKEKVAIAFGHGIDRGYDSLAYLDLTSQVTTGAWYTLNMPDTEWHEKRMRKADAIELGSQNTFRAYLRSQIESGEAFNLFFKTRNWDGMYAADEDDAGTGYLKEEAEFFKAEGVDQEVEAPTKDDELAPMEITA